MPSPIRIKISLPLGDLWYCCSGIKHVAEVLNTKVDMYLGIDVQMKFLDGVRGALSRQSYEMAKPLLEAQPWCNSVQEYTGQEVDRDLDQTQINPEINIPVMPYGHIARWQFYLFADMACDLSKPWIEVPQNVYNYTMNDHLVINRTARYRNEGIDYKFLKSYEGRMIFVGLYDEFTRFKQETGLSIDYFRVSDFVELARVLQQCRVFLGNQSMCFALAEAMKTPRILEVCHYCPNVIPEGPNGEDFVWQTPMEFYVKRAMR